MSLRRPSARATSNFSGVFHTLEGWSAHGLRRRRRRVGNPSASRSARWECIAVLEIRRSRRPSATPRYRRLTMASPAPAGAWTKRRDCIPWRESRGSSDFAAKPWRRWMRLSSSRPAGGTRHRGSRFCRPRIDSITWIRKTISPTGAWCPCSISVSAWARFRRSSTASGDSRSSSSSAPLHFNPRRWSGAGSWSACARGCSRAPSRPRCFGRKGPTI